MTIELACKRCGRPFSPAKDDLVRGPRHYHYCSEFCREAARKRPHDSQPRRPSKRALAGTHQMEMAMFTPGAGGGTGGTRGSGRAGNGGGTDAAPLD